MPGMLSGLTRMVRRWADLTPTLDETAVSEAPLRAELFSAEQMEQHGRVLAQTHRIAAGKARDRLLERLASNSDVLDDACALLSGALQAGLSVSPAGDWLLDNHYLIDEQIHTAQRHFPKGYSWQLPRLVGGASAGLPRVYDIALEAIAHGDGRVDQRSLARFVASYQEITPLDLGELWAIPIMLRLALIENLRRVAVRIARDRIHRNLAESWADRMVATAQTDPKSLILVIADMARSDAPMSSSYVAELTRRLQGHGAALALPLTWIEQRLAEEGVTIEQLIHMEHQLQASEQVSISNSIGSLRLLAVTDWREFVEDMSATERVLRADPSGIYPAMDFSSRDEYRHVIERVARASKISEIDVARRCVDFAAAAQRDAGTTAPEAHVGYYLIGAGYARLASATAVRRSIAEWRLRRNGRFPLWIYLTVVGSVTLAFATTVLMRAALDQVTPALLVVTGLLILIAGSQLAVTVMNWLAAALADAQPLPRMDYSRGIPPESRTLVVVPTLLGSVADADALVEALEVRFLANRDDNLHFALLTDFPDAAEIDRPGDAEILARAEAAITALNAEYAPERQDRFYLLHRPRTWNAAEDRYMGAERKRGKLADLNALLRGKGLDRFSLRIGDAELLNSVRYVITLDTDTQLPRESARRFVGTMAHPLNRPQQAIDGRRIGTGYGILQPRVSTSVPGAGSSRYAELFGGEPGFDPYTRAVSDAYQDLFGEGSFIGKGIYDVDAFEATMAERFPDNRILSHDLLEGCYARSGLLSDVELYETYPSRYLVDTSRRHRWVRGDWQLAGWLGRRVPAAEGAREANPLSWLAQWKIFDNLRRSLVSPALLALLLLGWSVLGRPAFWTCAVLVVVLLPAVVDVLLGLFNKPAEAPLVHHLANALRIALQRSAQAVFNLACLPFEAVLSLDAIVRTLWRVHISGRNLLQWTPSAVAEHQAAVSLAATVRTMGIAPALSLVTALILATWWPRALPFALPVLALWCLAPVAAWWISRPIDDAQDSLDARQQRFLGMLARRTWAFFERYVGADDNHLPPDNYQELPVAVIAHRTSPTNIGLSLLANLAANDLGYLTLDGLIARCSATFDTLQRLPRHRGHFHNWYDTRSLGTLQPAYISTVDSGNLSAHLLTLRQGLLHCRRGAVLSPRVLTGLAETIANLDAPSSESEAVLRLRNRIEIASSKPVQGAAMLRAELDAIHALCRELPAVERDDASQRGFWQTALVRQIRDALDTLLTLAPWFAADAPERCARALDALPIPDLETIANATTDWLERLRAELGDAADAAELAWLQRAHENIQGASLIASRHRDALHGLALRASGFADADYTFLYDSTRHLFSIGYNVSEHRRDNSYYDLLASEARLASFFAIAQGQIPQDNWFALGRLLTQSGGEPVLVSWSGSMFEYLMPSLVMPSYPGTLLDATCRAAVRRQISYGHQRDVPWGISESGYNLTDAALNYQYRAFGVPGLGLKRGLAEDLVIAPYACALALVVAPREACANLETMARRGWLGSWGFFEAIDFTPARLRRGQSHAVVSSYMAHHQGMSLLACEQVLLQRPMQARFEADPQFQATMLLLQERVPKASSYHSVDPERVDLRSANEAPQVPVRVFSHADGALPAVQLLGNGNYHLMLTNAGGGYSRCRDIALTRWREDTTRDDFGTFLYLRELDNDLVWSIGLQPMPRDEVGYEAVFTEARVEYRRRSAQIETITEIVVSPEDDIELRRTRIINRSRQRRVVEITSYAEVVLAPAIADALHPAFSNLFVQTEIVQGREAILCTRRARSAQEHNPAMFHLLALHDVKSAAVSYETDRARFVGRGGDARHARAMREAGPLSNTDGSVLDPIVAIRHRIVLEPEQTATLDLVTGMAATREACLALMEKYQDRRLADRVFDLAWTHSQVVLRQINVSDADAQLYGRLAAHLIYPHASLRADPSLIAKNRRGQSGLWGYAISGDLPIVLLQIRDPARIELVRQMVQAHAYWRLKGLLVDLVIWNEERGSYRQQLQDDIIGLIAAGIESHLLDRPGGIFVRNAEQIPQEDRMLMQAVARLIVSDTRGTLAEQARKRDNVDIAVPRLVPIATARARAEEAPDVPARIAPARLLENGIGGFSADGREYQIQTDRQRRTPAPWCNVLANRDFGCIVSESGGGYTWKDNAHEFRLTPWDNDPITDSVGEAYYLRDEDSGRFWSPSPMPACGRGAYTTRHGFGYSVFEHSEDGIESELWIYVSPDAPVKFWKLRVRNRSGRARRLSATGYVEWVLGDLRCKTGMHVVTELDPDSGAMFARNAYSAEFGQQVAFFDVDEATRTISGDRGEFIGRNGSLRDPASMSRTRLSGRVGAAMDACGAIQIPFELGDGQARELIFRLGVGNDAGDASALLQRFRRSGTARATLDAISAGWAATLGQLQVQTPDIGLNMLVNGWLLYQVIGCRLWARSGYYQSGGAFGFRDQLQDAMAIVHARPELLRAQILLAASRQFREGDVQHWWHPPAGRGVRTQCSDDYLWLPYAVSRYVDSTGDAALLGESVGFLEGRALNHAEDSYYDLPIRSDENGSIYEHCVRALKHGLRFGAHGLPLIGGGDWNDGMSHVGIEGRGESVWLGFFLYRVLTLFIPIAQAHDDAGFAQTCEHAAEELARNLETHGWDGAWYRRAFFDDGTPLGSSANSECRIDAIAQSWSVLSGAAPTARSEAALDALDQHLVRDESRLIQLLDPPFDRADPDPGYIRGYVPGVRENGGQYTHAAVWAAMAFAEAGRIERAWELLAMINPLSHASTPAEVETYKVEPYVVAADVYAVAPHIGRGGWTWYTGSAGWMYRLIVESLLGIHREGTHLRLSPRLPAAWPGFAFMYRYVATTYSVQVRRASAGESPRLTLDGSVQADSRFALTDDGLAHAVELVID
ncbi:MAG: glucoamylase family protein [Tahibacter sp.]